MSSLNCCFRKRASYRFALLIAALLTIQPAVSSAFASDEVLDWMQITNDTALSSNTTVANPVLTGRLLALVSASMFDAVNGIDPRYRPYHVRPDAPRHASKRAAAVEAAYEILVLFYPTLQPSLTAQRDASIAALTDSPRAIGEGMNWGQTVADAIWNWRLTDGFNPPPPPPFFGVQSIAGTPASVGAWRPTPPLNAPGAVPQLATITPWVLKRPSQFRVPPPYALTSSQYATDYNEIKVMGVFSGSGRTQDQSDLVIFWNGNPPLIWVRISLQLAASHGLTLTENAHLFALMDLAMADGFVAVWDSKYRYGFWRPITAIQNGDADGNAATDPNPAWTPWLDSNGGTPAHPEYPSAHAVVSGAIAYILASTFGDDTPFTATSNIFPGTRSFSSFSAALEEIADARVFGGIHFRTSCEIGNGLGRSVGNYVLTHALRPQEDDDHNH